MSLVFLRICLPRYNTVDRNLDPAEEPYVFLVFEVIFKNLFSSSVADVM